MSRFGIIVNVDKCVGCHACENRCPFDVEVTENMRQAVNVFGK